jgi:hypothetical protein
MPLWWHEFMLWMDNTTIPVWIPLLVVIGYLLVVLWRDVSRALSVPPPRD